MGGARLQVFRKDPREVRGPTAPEAARSGLVSGDSKKYSLKVPGSGMTRTSQA